MEDWSQPHRVKLIGIVSYLTLCCGPSPRGEELSMGWLNCSSSGVSATACRAQVLVKVFRGMSSAFAGLSDMQRRTLLFFLTLAFLPLALTYEVKYCKKTKKTCFLNNNSLQKTQRTKQTWAKIMVFVHAASWQLCYCYCYSLLHLANTVYIFLAVYT